MTGKLALVFPGQGSQRVGMGKDLSEQSPAAREMFAEADGLLGYALSRICFDGPEAELRQTEHTQPAIFLHSIVLMKLLEHTGASMVAGHSLGEYSALVYAGAMSWQDGLKLVRLRGRLMQQAGTESPGTMAAVVGLEPPAVEDCCRRASAEGPVQCANFNSPGQIVISGSVPGVRSAMQLAKSGGAKLVRELEVSGAFHSTLMESARRGLRDALRSVPIADARIPVYANVSALPVQKAEEIRTLLEQQLTSPVRWQESVIRMIGDGAERFVEIGPGKVLQGLVRRTNSQVGVQGIETWEDVVRHIPSAVDERS